MTDLIRFGIVAVGRDRACAGAGAHPRAGLSRV